MENQSAKEWLDEEIQRVNVDMADTLNGRFQASLLDLDEENKELTLRFPLQDWQVNGLGTLHGGMVSAMMDLAMCMAVFCESRQTIPPTLSMTVNYLRPVPMEEEVYMKARVTSCGKRNATAYCEAIVPATGKVAATSIGTYAIIAKRD